MLGSEADMVVVEEKNNLIYKLKEKIQHLESIIALLPGHVYWLDRENVLQGCNNLQAEFANLPSRRAIVGKKNADLLHADEASELDSINNRVMETGKPYIGEELAEMPHGQRVYLSQKVPLRNEQDEVVGLLGVSFDITDRKRMEKELQIARERAELANQTKTEFIRNLEHDIRTPLCGIKSVTKYLETIEDDAKKKDFLSDIEIATNELLNYLDNIVEFSQINTGATPLIVKEFNLEQVVKGIVNLELAAARSKQLDLRYGYASNVPMMVIGDRFRLHRMLLNLVNNAIKFTEQGYVKISVGFIEKINEKEVLLEIAVGDTGIGIAKKHHETIYDKFTRCDPSNKGIYKGTGLGLWIVKQFIEDLDGQIKLTSELGCGSIFTCRLPFRLP
jgi:two-component system aerobic respiration control sensor histidine kinase ArcB